MQYNLLILLLSSLLLLSGCGLETEQEDEEDTSNLSNLEQHPLLPLSDGSALTYLDDSLGDVVAYVSLSSEDSSSSNSVYSVNFTDDSLNLGLLFASKTTGVQWVGIDGPIDIPYGNNTITLESLRFDTPITIIGANAVSGTTGASLKTSDDNVNQATATVSYQISSSNGVFDQAAAFYGTLPTLNVNITSSLELSLGTQPLPSLNGLSTQLGFTSGIGIVRHQSDFQGTALDSRLTGLRGLPQTIWYQVVGTDPILANGSDAVVTTDGGPLPASQFAVFNQTELDQLDWLNIRVDEASDSYVVEVVYSENLPTTLTSVQILFQDQENPDQLISGNVTLLNE